MSSILKTAQRVFLWKTTRFLTSICIFWVYWSSQWSGPPLDDIDPYNYYVLLMAIIIQQQQQQWGVNSPSWTVIWMFHWPTDWNQSHLMDAGKHFMVQLGRNVDVAEAQCCVRVQGVTDTPQRKDKLNISCGRKTTPWWENCSWRR